jgi:hypothetical protein
MLKRLSIILLALAFVASATMQLMPHAFAAVAAGAAEPCNMADMKSDASPGAADEMPCKGAIPVCGDNLGCVVVVDLPQRPQAAPVAVRWTEIVWSLVQRSLAGVMVSPELQPPIAIV